MKKLVLLVMCLMLGMSFLVGCGEKEAAPDTETTGAGAVEEMADTTRLDSMVDEVIDTVAEAVESAVEEAVDEATGE